jgi:hypothetical protein
MREGCAGLAVAPSSRRPERTHVDYLIRQRRHRLSITSTPLTTAMIAGDANDNRE